MTTLKPSPSTTIAVDALAALIGEQDVVVIDASVHSTRRPGGGVFWNSGIDVFRERHIPGAVFADIIHSFSQPHARLHFTVPSAIRFQEGARALGVDPDSLVVVYDDEGGAFAARLWWLFRAFGHESVAVLDGGLTAWTAQRLPLESGETEHEQGTFVAAPREGSFIAKEDVARISAGAPGTLICALPPENPRADIGFRGRAGRIPGTKTVPAASLLTEGNTLLPDPALTAAFDGTDITGARPVVTYCGGGINASLAALALTRLGVEDVRIYDGSLNEWALDPEAPLESVAS